MMDQASRFDVGRALVLVLWAGCNASTASSDRGARDLASGREPAPADLANQDLFGEDIPTADLAVEQAQDLAVQRDGPAQDLAPVDGPGARDFGGVDRGFISTPGFIDCMYGGTGSASCVSTPAPEMNLSTESYCCYRGPFTGDPPSATCVMGNLGACETGVPFYCDEAADCDPGLVCCRSTVRELFSCSSGCAGQPQICKTDGECLNGTVCSGLLSNAGLVVGVCQ
jgi:hypothetical protein